MGRAIVRTKVRNGGADNRALNDAEMLGVLDPETDKKKGGFRYCQIGGPVGKPRITICVRGAAIG